MSYAGPSVYIAHIWSPTLFPRGILIFQGVLTKFNFLTKFQHLKNYYIDLMKDPKYEHQSTFALWGGSNLILGTGREKNFFLTTPAAINFFHQILKK